MITSESDRIQMTGTGHDIRGPPWCHLAAAGGSWWPWRGKPIAPPAAPLSSSVNINSAGCAGMRACIRMTPGSEAGARQEIVGHSVATLPDCQRSIPAHCFYLRPPKIRMDVAESPAQRMTGFLRNGGCVIFFFYGQLKPSQRVDPIRFSRFHPAPALPHRRDLKFARQGIPLPSIPGKKYIYINI